MDTGNHDAEDFAPQITLTENEQENESRAEEKKEDDQTSEVSRSRFNWINCFTNNSNA